MMFELQQKLNKEKINVIDVREEDEYVEGHIKGALNAPISKFMNYLDKIDKKNEYYVVCYSGSRSQIAAQYLGNNGYKVTNVLGGMSVYRGELEYEV